LKKKVGGYFRLSDEDRFKTKETDYSESIKNQIDLFDEFVAGFPDWEIYDYYVDDDVSGASQNRPDFQRILKDCENGLLDIVICKTQSRFTRTMEEVESIIHNKFDEWNVRFIGIVDHADTEVKGNKKARQINGLVNEWYLEDGSANIRSVLDKKRKAGQFTGSFAPYGYLIDPEDKNHLVVDPVASEVVKEIFKMYASGAGYQKIRNHLNDKNILSPLEYKKALGSKYRCDVAKATCWNTYSIARILRNECYLGRLTQKKTTNISYKNKKKRKLPREEWIIADDTHDAIIDKETWHKVAGRLKTNHRCEKTNEVHVLSKKVYCKECDMIYTKVPYHLKNGKQAYLRCKSSVVYGKEKCANTSIQYQYLLDAVLESFKQKVKEYLDETELSNCLKNKTSNTLYDNKITALKKETAVIESNLNKKKGYFKKLYEDRSEGILSDEEYMMLKEDYDIEIKQLQSRLAMIDEELVIVNSKKEKDMNAEALIRKYKDIKELSREVVEEFIEKIYIHPSNHETNSRNIAIEWTLF